MKTILADIRIKEDARRALESTHPVRILAMSDASERDIASAEMLLCGALPSTFGAMGALRLIQLYSVGYSQVQNIGLAARGIRVCNARGVFDSTIAEWNMAMMINLARDLRQMIRQQEAGQWERSPARFQNALRGRVLGIWGYGGIGRETARLARAFGMIVHVMTRSGIRPRPGLYQVPGTGDPEGVLPHASFIAGQETAFLQDLDFLVLAMPHTPENTGLLGEKELRSMKPSAFLLNPARGPLVEEAALIRALEEKWIAGAALDTHHHYPMPPDHPLWSMPQVIMTPHISGSDQSPHFLDRVWEIIAHNTGALFQDIALWNEIPSAELA